jgi:hypothetical protein
LLKGEAELVDLSDDGADGRFDEPMSCVAGDGITDNGLSTQRVSTFFEWRRLTRLHEVLFCFILVLFYFVLF